MSKNKIEADNRASQAKSDEKKIEARTQQVKPPEQDKPWTPPSSLDAPPAPDGYKHRWLRAESMGFDDTSNMSAKLRSGYELVRADQYPDANYPTVQDGKYKGVIGVGGLLLARIPEEIALQIEAYYNKKTQEKDEAINNDLMKERQAGMKFRNESASSVTFGGTKKS